MKSRCARAFAPAGISSFFEICDKTVEGEPIADLEKVGARGGGFVIQKGVQTTVEVSEDRRNTAEIFINGRVAPEAETSRAVVEMLLAKTGAQYSVLVHHDVEVPVGAGFGSSAAGALGTALALSNALNMRLTYNQLGRVAHVAEVKCKTGLGTVGPIMLGGCILTIEPGAPGISIIDRLPLPPNCSIVAATFSPTPTKNVLMASPEKRTIVNRCGRETLNAILEEPSMENFLLRCREFSEQTGFITQRAKELMKLAAKAGAIGAAQNMIGDAVHALTKDENAGNVAAAFKQMVPKDRILTTKIDFQGCRLLE